MGIIGDVGVRTGVVVSVRMGVRSKLGVTAFMSDEMEEEGLSGALSADDPTISDVAVTRTGFSKGFVSKTF